jgi:Domain of unknown function (DUF1905)/Bacteriocin-protection, YdeI or OmpD-Associated
METPLVNQTYILEKIEGKGGWTYVAIPEIAQDKHAHFGLVKVRGYIDSFEIKRYNLMPMGNGKLFLPVRAEIRKKIGKEKGDTVHVVLYADNSPLEIPEELQLCFQDDPDAHKRFLSYTEGEQKAFIDWILAAKRDETRIERIAVTLNKLAQGLKFSDKL